MSANFEYYKVFYYVAKFRSITLAAQELSLTQPSVTRAIQSLENQVGCKLFTRSKKGVALTTEGKMIYQRIYSGCELFFSAEHELEHLKSIGSGTVCIGTDDLDIRRDYLINITEQFHELYPQVGLRIVQKDGMELLDALETGTIDFCILADSSPETSDRRSIVESTPTIECWRIYEYQDVAIVGKALSHLAEHELTLAELSEYPLIIWGPDTASRNYFEEMFRERGLVAAPAVELTNIEFQILMTERGFGYSFVPLHCVEDKIREGVVFPLRITDCMLKRQLLMVTNKIRPLSVAARMFLNIMKTQADMPQRI